LNFGQRGILKYLIFGSLFILVRFVNFNCFTLRYFQITFVSQCYYFLHFSPNTFKIAFQSKYFVFCKFVSILLENSQVFFILLKMVPFSFFLFCKAVQIFYIFADWSPRSKRSQFKSKATPDSVQSTCHKLIGSQAHMAAYKRHTVSEIHRISATSTQTTHIFLSHVS